MDCPWRAVALLVAVLAQQASAAPCAKVAEQQSNGWLHMDGTKKFSIQLNIEEWLAYENIQLTWPGAQQILIENVFNAQLAAGARPTAELNAQRRQPSQTSASVDSFPTSTAPLRLCHVLAGTANGGDHIVIELGRTAVDPPSVVIMGTGTTSTSPTITCRCARQTTRTASTPVYSQRHALLTGPRPLPLRCAVPQAVEGHRRRPLRTTRAP